MGPKPVGMQRRASARLKLLGAACAAAALGGLASVPLASSSAFPGGNGKIVYQVEPFNGNGNYLATANSDGSGPAAITSPLAGQTDSWPRFSADGTTVVFIRSGGIRTVNASGGTVTDVTISPALPSGDTPIAPTFTPDGKSIAFEAFNINTGGSDGIYEVAVAGGAATQLTSGNDSVPAFSPDGTKLAFARAGANRTSTLEVADASGTTPNGIYTGTVLGGPDWSPDGKTLAFSQDNGGGSGNRDIFTIATTGGSPTHVTNGAANDDDTQPAFSPDGTEIAFVDVNYLGAAAIKVVGVSGGCSGTVYTAPSGQGTEMPDWQPIPGTTTTACSNTNTGTGTGTGTGTTTGTGTGTTTTTTASTTSTTSTTSTPTQSSGPSPTALGQTSDKASVNAVDTALSKLTATQLLSQGSVTAMFSAWVKGMDVGKVTGKLGAHGQISSAGHGKRKGPKIAVLLTGTVTVSKPGQVSITLTLTSAGRRFLSANRKHHHAAHLTIKMTFTPVGGKPAVDTGTVKLKP